MPSLGRLSQALVSGNNENNMCLANFNLDFALVRYDAPKEFNALGSALSLKRRMNAEEGPPHRVTRKLGVLFAQSIPSTPLLVKAFGQRASEIIQTPGVNPQGTRADGPFQEFVGVDATSIWAAATSGVASIAVLLLACMLARKFVDAKYAIAIWTELVAERQKEIRIAESSGEIILETTMMAARQNITREELAAFDASARSWLSSADEVKVSEQKRLMLILKNIPTPVSVGVTTYGKVLSAWAGAMIGLEDLLKGMPQQISDSAILLALSAWHLYPDLLVLSKETKKVNFNDSLFSGSAIVTVGLQWSDNHDSQGIQWSLALSHLYHYGDPIEIDSRGDGTRVTMQQLHMMAFGALLASWQVPLKMVVDSAKWFNAFWRLLQETSMLTWGPPISCSRWIEIFADAASNLIESSGDERETCRMLINLGHRRGKAFLGNFDKHLFGLPFFGLCNPHILGALCKRPGIESSLDFIRSVASALNLAPDRLVVAYDHVFDGEFCTIIATAIPHERSPTQPNRVQSRDGTKIHVRWIVSWSSTNPFERKCSEAVGATQLDSHAGSDKDLKKEFEVVNGEEMFSKAKPGTRGKQEAAVMVDIGVRNQNVLPDARAKVWESKTQWIQRITDKGESAFYLYPSRSSINPGVSWQSTFSDELLVWYMPPALFASAHAARSCSASQDGVYNCARFDDGERLSSEPCKFRRISGTHRQITLYLRDDNSISVLQFERMWKEECNRWSPIATGTAAFNEKIVDTQHLREYLYCISTTDQDAGNEHIKKAFGPSSLGIHQCNSGLDSTLKQDHLKSFTNALLKLQLPNTLIDSLNALNFATELYRHFPSVTIPVGILSRPIHKGKWFQKHAEHFRRGWNVTQGTTVARPLMAEAFSCIAMFESGGLDIDPIYLSNVFALSSRNSIFVASVVLSDPSDSSDKEQVRRIIGNIESPGISLLVSPKKPRMKAVTDDYRVIVHADYDGRREDNFQGTSLHLAFTNWKTPLTSGEYGLIDDDVLILEGVISVCDRGAWVADIDILAAASKATRQAKRPSKCRCRDFGGSPEAGQLTSIDNWDELFDPPENQGIVRAHGNWPARRAALCILHQKYPTVPVALLKTSEQLCWRCFKPAPGVLFYLD